MFGTKIFPASGGGQNIAFAKKAIRLARHGCANRPFYHIVVMIKGRNQHEQPIEQVGSFDLMPNERNEKLVAFNYERLQYWIGEGAEVSKPVAELLGLSGFLPVHPRTYMNAWRNRRAQLATENSQNEQNSSDNQSEPAAQNV